MLSSAGKHAQQQHVSTINTGDSGHVGVGYSDGRSGSRVRAVFEDLLHRDLQVRIERRNPSALFQRQLSSGDCHTTRSPSDGTDIVELRYGSDSHSPEASGHPRTAPTRALPTQRNEGGRIPDL